MNNTTILIIFVFLTILNTFNCKNLNLQLKLNSFENIYGVKSDRKCCFNNLLSTNAKCARECSTFFHFCIKTTTSTTKCQTEFETDILGGNLITKEHFDQTTDSIQLPLNDDSATLEVLVYNDKSPFGQKQPRELISKWTLDLLDKQKTLKNIWNVFNMSQLLLNQKFSFAYSFVCSSDYEGDNCEQRKLNKPLKNFKIFNETFLFIAICSANCDLSKGGYCTQPNECLCRQGWYGSNCDLEVPVLCTLDCKNNGKCSSDKNGQYCKCTSEFKGSLCDVKIESNCDSNIPCLNGGTCTNNACVCPPGYIGDRCQLKSLPSQCGDKQCLNNGKCFLDNNNNYQCKCQIGYSGEQCEFVLDICKRESPCGSNGICKSNGFDEYTCDCKHGFTGLNCSDITFVQVVSPQQESISVYEVILIACIGIAFPIISILIIIIIIRMRRDSKQVIIEKQAKDYNNEKSIDEKMVKIELENEADDYKQVKQQDKDTEFKNVKINFIENNLFNNDNLKEKCNNKSKIIFNNELKQKSINIQNFNGDFNLMASIV